MLILNVVELIYDAYLLDKVQTNVHKHIKMYQLHERLYCTINCFTSFIYLYETFSIFKIKEFVIMNV